MAMAIQIESEERNFSLLFQDVLDVIRTSYGVSDSDIEEAIYEIVECFKSYKFLDMIEWRYLCGYLFRYAAHGAGLSRHRILKALRNSEDLASNLKSRDLNIISLGGGPGSDIIGLCSALFEIGVKNKTLNITVVDKYENWSTCVDRVNEMVRKSDFGNASELFRLNNVTISFLQVILPGSPTQDKEYFELLKKADVVLMAKLLSSMNNEPEEENLMMTLCCKMKKGAFILHIESSNREEKFFSVKNYHPVKQNFDVLFESNEDEYYYPMFNIKFNSSDRVSSNAQIYVFRKKQ